MVFNIAVFLLQAFLISLSGVLAPGAVTAATIAAGTRMRHAGLWIALGHILVEFPVMMAIYAGMGRLFEMESVKIIIGLTGGAFLLWMGSAMFKSVKADSRNTMDILAVGHPVRIGIILSISNPYFLLWWATIGLTLATDARRLGWAAFVLFMAVHWFCDAAWLETLSFTSFKGGEVLGPKRLKFVLIVCAVTLIIFGAIFLFKALKQILGA